VFLTGATSGSGESLTIAIEGKKKFAAFPWQLAAIVRAGLFLPAWLYD